MGAETFEARMYRLIAEATPAKFKKKPITAQTRLKQDLGIDSLGMLALLFRFEQSFGLNLASIKLEVTLEQMQTVGDAIAIGRELVGESETEH